MPELSGMPMVAQPTSIGDHIQVSLPTVDDLTSAVSWANSHAFSSGLAVRLEQQWAKSHDTIMDDSPLAPESSDDIMSECCRVGMCLCSPSGLGLKRCAEKCSSYLQTFSTMRSQFRKGLGDGFIVAKVIGEPVASDDVFGSEEAAIVEIWLHIGLHYF